MILLNIFIILINGHIPWPLFFHRKDAFVLYAGCNHLTQELHKEKFWPDRIDFMRWRANLNPYLLPYFRILFFNFRPICACLKLTSGFHSWLNHLRIISSTSNNFHNCNANSILVFVFLNLCRGMSAAHCVYYRPNVRACMQHGYHML